MRDSSKSDLEGRTRQLTARIKEGTLQQMHRMAAHEGITLGEFIERAIAAYDENGEG
jgi:predicted HicB family RNase H-like nuclease